MKNNIKENFINTIFFEGDYMSDQTASGKEEVGKRLQFDIDTTLTKEQVETLYDLVLRGLDFYEHLEVDTEKLLKAYKG
tara:strand:- start:3296 stop:3532 length:237 start_codon:yes stop_codon:yes gene_type:complete